MMLMNYQAVLFKSFNEGLHYYYMKGLVATRNYREALKYYDELNDIFLSELGTGLSKRFKQLYDIIIAARTAGIAAYKKEAVKLCRVKLKNQKSMNYFVISYI